MTEYRIDDLARLVGTTVRNIRAYQDRGLLAPPRLLGRVGLYSEAHVARLRAITSLLQRGYASAQIHELLRAWEQGKDVGAIIDLEGAVTDPWSDERPVEMPTSELREVLASDTEDFFDRFVEMGWVEPADDISRVRSPRLLEAFKEAASLGFDKRALVELYEAVDPAMDDVAQHLVGTAVEHLLADHGDTWMPDDSESTELAAMLMRLRQLTVSTVRVTLAKAMERATQQAVEEHLQRIADKNRPTG
ncbi:MerR family transcriptional regulator [Aeromicrobium sp.]|uniref:MerR family transcriptional regulator n=1 Tax=Aeromicrobium sp. TaxID=1871063 RepID=UPI0030BFE886